jgi:hypothetical protein
MQGYKNMAVLALSPMKTCLPSTIPSLPAQFDDALLVLCDASSLIGDTDERR